MIKRNQTTLVIGIYLAFITSYSAFGDAGNIFWVVPHHVLDNLFIAWAVARAAPCASNIQATLLGYSFAAYELIHACLNIFSGIMSEGDVDKFDAIAGGNTSELIMILSALIVVWTGRLIHKFKINGLGKR